MSRQLVAAVDQGSTATKAAVVDPDGEILELLREPVERSVDGPRIEHDAELLASGVEELLGRLLGRHEVAAIGVTCQRSTCLLWERATARPLTPALSWQDRRESERVAALADHADEVARSTGLRLSPHYAAPKLAGLFEGSAEASEAAGDDVVAGTLDAFLIHRLTGRPSTEPGQAGRTLLYDLETDAWDEGLGRLFGVPIAALPAILPSAGERGRFRGVPVTALAGDQQAALLGHGGWRPGIAAAHFGTGAFVLASTGERLLRHPGLLSAVLASTAERRLFQIEGSVNSAGSAVDWAAQLGGIDLDAWADRPLDPERLPVCLPAFAGLAAPWWRAEAEAAFFGLRLEHTADDLLAGVLAGIAMRVSDCVEAIRAAGAEVATLRVSGKLTRLAGLTELVAEAARIEVEVRAGAEAGLAGIARLAALATGGETESMGAAAGSSRVHRPSWPAERSERVRDRWRARVRQALQGPVGSPETE